MISIGSRIGLQSMKMMSRTSSVRCMSTYFTKSHEFIKVESGVGTIGITQHAADALGDIVYVSLPDVGDTFDAGESFGSVESVKAASDVYLPVGGEVVEVNELLDDEPGTVNSSPLENGWFVKIKLDSDGEAAASALMDETAYKSSL